MAEALQRPSGCRAAAPFFRGFTTSQEGCFIRHKGHRATSSVKLCRRQKKKLYFFKIRQEGHKGINIYIKKNLDWQLYMLERVSRENVTKYNDARSVIASPQKSFEVLIETKSKTAEKPTEAPRGKIQNTEQTGSRNPVILKPKSLSLFRR